VARAATTTDAFNAIAEPRRREILDLLVDGERSVGDLVELLGLGQPQVSKHLRVLREVRVVDVRPEGRERFYRLNGPALKPIHDWVMRYERAWTDRFEALDLVWKTSNRRRMVMAAATNKRAVKVTLPSEEEILIEREFDAPKHLVYTAYTTPELVKRWWAGQRGEVTECEIDLCVGGRWRYVMVAHGQFEVAFHGEYREIVPNERIVSTQIYEAVPDAPGLATTTFSEVDGRTTLAILVRHTSRENRDGHLNSGMEAGTNESLDLLEQVALSLP